MPKYSKNLVFRSKGVLLEIPVRVTSTISQNKSPVHDVCLDCKKGFVGNKRYCKNCNCENTKDNIGSGMEIGDDLKVFSKEEVSEIKIESSNLIIKGLTDTSKLDLSLRQAEKPYYLYPDKKDSDAKKMYAVIFNALKDNDKSIIVTWKVSSRSSRDSEAVISPIGDILVIRQIAYKEELNDIDENIDLSITKEEKVEGKAFLNLIPKASIDDLVDEYQQKLDKLLSGKTKTVQVSKQKPKKKQSLFGFSDEQLKEALQSSSAEEILNQTKSKPDETETVKAKKGGKQKK